MSRQNMTRPQSSNRRQPLLPTQASSGKSRLAEVAGGTTAECAAVCCCCPCGLLNLLYLAIYKVPAGLCRRALKRKRTRQLVKKGLLQPRRHRYSCGYDETGIQIHQVLAVDGLSPEIKSKQMEESEKEVMKLEKEMWERFYGTGFWRSPSQRESPQTVVEMEETNPESHMTSAAAFVEGGIQQAYDDACSICLEEFSDSDPSTVTICKHEFHLQCILEWCQRSSQCPMCWQPISLKDPTSQELLEAVVRERSFRVAPPRNATIFHHPTLGDFELQHLPVGANDAELEERIIQHLAAAAAMGRAHHIGRREGQRSRPTAHGRPHFLVFSTHPGGPPGPVSAPIGDNEPAAISGASPSTPLASGGDELSQPISHFPSVHTDQVSSPSSGSTFLLTNHPGISFNNRSPASHSSPPNQDRAGPSDFQSFSESLKSKFNAMSMRYKESFSKSTRGWKERLFSRNNSISDIGSDVQREVNEGIASVSRMMDRLETRESSTASEASVANHLDDSSVTEQGNQNIVETREENPLNDSNQPASCAAGSSSG